MQEVFSI